MRIRELFTVPEGKKVTEKLFGRVLLSSICSILLCMVCLISTTWAWFTVSVENKENVIQIAAVTQTVTVINTADNEVMGPQNGSYHLAKGTYAIHIRLQNDATGPDDLNQQKGPVYVVMAVTHSGATQYYCLAFEGSSADAEQILQANSEPVEVSFSVAWLKPAAATLLDDEPLAVGEIPAQMTEAPAAIPTTVPRETAVPPTTEPPESDDG